jgi:hypothetical protein
VKYFLIEYHFKEGSVEEYHKDIELFISELDADPELRGRISYRCLKGVKDSAYHHLACVPDEQTLKIMQERDFFKRYSARVKAVAGGEVTVSPLELIAETQERQ